MKHVFPPALPFGLSLLLFVIGCRSIQQKSEILFPGLIQTTSAQPDAAALFAELGGDQAFLDLARYLYRWYLDEDDLERFDPACKGQLWIRRVQTVADANDNSRYLEVTFPAIGVTVTLKKNDYRISELKLTVKSDGYRVIRVCREAGRCDARPEGAAALNLDVDALYQRLFQMRLERQYPGEALQAHVQADILRHADQLVAEQQGKAKTLFFAPVHAIDNELWVFWEEGKRLFKYSSDMDLTNPDVLAYDKLDLAVFDAVEQTVVSHEEKPGDNRFVTRDQVGRALFNCIVLGQRREAR